MKLKVKILKFLAGRPVCMINKETAEEMSLHVDNRVSIKKSNKKIISIVDISRSLNKNEIVVSNEIVKQLKLKNRESVEVKLTERPHSIDFIKKKLNGEKLTKQEITEIVNDISRNALREVEIAFFISALHSQKMSLQETKYLINAMVKSGSQLELKGKIADKHSIGGIAGNRTTPIIVSICASTGLIMPKTSSRAITTAAATVDVMEAICNVDFSIKEIKKIISKTNACLVWGGGLGLAPVDDKIIKIERIVKIDSDAQLLASILSKKISVNSKYILIDIPYGKSAKVSKRKAEKLKLKFLHLGKKFNLKLKVVLTDGSQPIGNSVGPFLEINDIIKILKRDETRPKDLEEKSVMLSGKLLEMTGKAKRGKGEKLALEILDSGKAFEKFKQIIKAQQGSLKIIRPGKYRYNIKARRSGKVKVLDNKLINTLARQAGCPEDKAAGIYIHKKVGQKTKKQEKIMTLYAISREKLKHAVNYYNKNKKKMIKI